MQPHENIPVSARSLQPGQLLSNRYRIVSLVGHGGMGEVYEAEDTVLNMPVALKTIRGEVTETALRRFQREVVLARQVGHHNVCRMFDFGSDETAGAFLTMEMLRGRTLAQLLKERGPLGGAEAKSIAVQVADGLAAAHAHGIVHRDLKPGNIFLTDEGRVVVTDFGLARAASSDTSTGTETGSGVIAGTPAYMSPEQITGGEPAPAVDLYALGVVMYEMTTGRLPWVEGSGASRFVSTPEPPRVDASWDSATLRCLSVSPSRRFSSAAELRAFLQGGRQRRWQSLPWRSLPWRSLTWRSLTWRSLTWRSLTWIALACAGLIAVIVLVLTTRRPWSPRPEAVSWYSRGVSALHDGDYNAAAKQLQMAVEADPKFAMAHARLAQAWAEQDFADRARQSMLQASTIAASYPGASRTEDLRLLAIQMTVARDFEGALQRYRAIADSSRDAASEFDLARALERAARNDEAIVKYREVVTMQEPYAAAWSRLGTLLGRKALYPDSTTAFNKAESIFNTAGNLAGSAEVRLQRAVVLTAQGLTDEASRVLASALKLAEATGFESQRIRILLRMGVLARLQEQNADAERYASEALQLADENRMEQYSLDGLLDLGNVHLQKRDLANAEKYYGDALRIARGQNSRFHEARSMVMLASVRSQQGRLDDARSGAERALEFFRAAGYNNETLATLALLAQVRSQTGDSAGALAAFEEQLKLIPAANLRASTETHLRIGITLSQLERYSDALVHLNAALLAPVSVTRAYAAINKARILMQTGAHADATTLLTDSKLLTEPTGMAEIRAAGIRAALSLHQGQLAAAIAEGEAAARKLRDRDASLRLEILSDVALARAFSGDRRRASMLCTSLVREPAGVRSQAVARLACAEVGLVSNQVDAARKQAHEAAASFLKLDQPEQQWRACLVEMLASSPEDAAKKRVECETIRNAAMERWGAGLWERYLLRPDVQSRLARVQTNLEAVQK